MHFNKYRMLGAVLAAALSLGAWLASPAFAEEEGKFRWDPETTYLTTDTLQDQTFTVLDQLGGLSVRCDTVNATVHLDNSGEATTLETESLTYVDAAKGGDKCRGPLGTEPKIEMNGCQYLFHVGTTIATDETEGEATINCPAGKQIVVNAPGCVITVPGGQRVGPVFFIGNTTSGDFSIAPNVKNIKYSTTGFLCGNHLNQVNGTYVGISTITGEDEEGNPTNVWVE